MAKKYKSNKLLKQSIQAKQTHTSSFGKFANRLADAKKRKIQKLTDTQKRLLQSKKNNKMIKISKKAKKFALLDQQDQNGQAVFGQTLTHKGMSIKDLKEFDDVDFNESDLQNDEQFDKIQDKMNFAGFQATGNLLEDKQEEKNDDRPKSKNDIYKQIIQKSKAYKMFRQQQYEQNFNKANQLDQGFGQLISQLKFRNKDQKLRQKIENVDPQFDRLMNQLKQDDRIVSNKIVEKNQKYTQKIRKKKNDQLNKIMKDSDGQDGDIRGWVDQAEEQSQQDQQNNQPQSSDQQDQDNDNQLGASNEQAQQDQQQGSYDQLDEVDLSSSQQQQQQGVEQQEQDEQQGDVQQEEIDDSNQGQQDQELDSQVEDDDQNDQEDDQEEDSGSQQQQDEQNQEQQQPVYSGNSKKQQINNKKQSKGNSNNQLNKPSNKPVQADNSAHKNKVIQAQAQKKRKLNFIQ